MTRLHLREDMLVVTIEGWHKVLALKSQIEVPLANISGARVRPVIPTFVDGDFRGTHVPGKVVAGFLMNEADGVVFCDVEDPKRAIAIDLVDGQLKHIIVELSDITPEKAVDFIEHARRGVAMTQPSPLAEAI